MTSTFFHYQYLESHHPLDYWHHKLSSLKGSLLSANLMSILQIKWKKSRKDINQEKLVVNSQERALINLVVNTKYIEVKTSSGGIIKLSGTTKHQDVNLDL